MGVIIIIVGIMLIIAHKNKGKPEQITAFRKKNVFQPIESQAYEAADDGSEEPVAAVAAGVLHIEAKAENGTDTGKGGIAAGEENV